MKGRFKHCYFHFVFLTKCPKGAFLILTDEFKPRKGGGEVEVNIYSFVSFNLQNIRKLFTVRAIIPITSLPFSSVRR